MIGDDWIVENLTFLLNNSKRSLFGPKKQDGNVKIKSSGVKSMNLIMKTTLIECGPKISKMM